jgi:hypothetical protein
VPGFPGEPGGDRDCNRERQLGELDRLRQDPLRPPEVGCMAVGEGLRQALVTPLREPRGLDRGRLPRAPLCSRDISPPTAVRDSVQASDDPCRGSHLSRRGGYVPGRDRRRPAVSIPSASPAVAARIAAVGTRVEARVKVRKRLIQCVEGRKIEITEVYGAEVVRDIGP